MTPKTNYTEAESINNYETSWEPKMAEQIRSAVTNLTTTESDRKLPYMVAMVGIPGSGKTISAFLLASMLEEMDLECMVMPHDGYHYPLDHLKMFPDADEAIYRRGAPDTFDPHMLKHDLDRIREGDEDHIMVPGFDHAKGDPEPETHAFDRHRHKVVLCEGLYLLHNEDGWEEVDSIFDLKIFIDSNVDNCIERLKIRNQCIPGYTPEQIAERCEVVDRVNATTVIRSKKFADVVVKSFVPKQPPTPTFGPMTPSHERVTSDLDALNLINQHDIDAFLDNDFERPGYDPMGSQSEIATEDIPEPPPASAFVGTWEPELAERICKEMKEKPDRTPYTVALVGIPGSGKSISALLLASTLEDNYIPCMVMPHDGYHYAKDYLRTFPDADDAIYRRGAPDTFDPSALKRDLDRIREGDEEVITVPAFDHAKGDPEPDKHIFDRQRHKVLLCEGLYLLHDQDGWEDIASSFDLTIFMNADVDICVERVKVRNLCVPGYTPEEILERCERVDRVNAMTVMKSKARADVIVDSKAMKQ